MKVGIYTLGCKVNTYESEFIISEFKSHGYEIGDFNDSCDIYIINTCTVTNTSDLKSKKIINNTIKRKGKSLLIVMGCFIQANQKYQNSGIDIILGNKDKSKIMELVTTFLKNQKPINKTSDHLGDYFENMEITTSVDRTRAFVKIEDGCENFCSYCIIPYVRGKCVSKDPTLVIKEITNLVKTHKEIVLTGIHTGNYGIDIGTTLATLLQTIIKIPNLKRLRLSSLEVTEINDEILILLKNSDIIVNHLHIPLQAGSDEILKLMNRKYDLKYYFKKMSDIRKIRPDIALTTDVIVGFPGEDERLFKETLKTCQKLKFTKIHVFPYSKRNNTTAINLPDHVDETVKKARARSLISLSKELEIKYMQKYLDKEVIILTENYKDGYTYGHTSNYLFVKVVGKFSHNSELKVTITSLDYPFLSARKSKK